MSHASSERSSPAGAAASGAAPSGPPPLHARSFKLRFATQHELGRSNVSAVKPLGLPSVVRGKSAGARADAAAEAAALRRVRALFGAGPRERLAAPATSAHEYGWWSASAPPADPRLRHHIRDSAWLKERLRVLATDHGLARR